MSDNIKEIGVLVDQKITNANGVGTILASDHNAIIKAILDKVGRNVGLSFTAQLDSNAGVIPAGVLSWNGNAMNNDQPFTMTVSANSGDLSNALHPFSVVPLGSILQFKDHVGRVSLFLYGGYVLDKDTANNDVLNVSLIGLVGNINYTYQAGEQEKCIISFYSKGIASSSSGEVRIGNLWFYPPNVGDDQVIVNGQEFRGFVTPGRYVTGIVVEANGFDIDNTAKASIFTDEGPNV